jgi:alanyl-tRNA synthetase
VVVVTASEAARELGHKAGALARTAAQTLGGGGGGKDDVAQGGGTDPAAVDDALEAVRRQLAG